MIESIKRPYIRTTEIHSQSDIESWEKVTLADDSSVTKELRGKTFFVSPAFGVARKERNHHEIEVEIEGSDDSVINFHMGHAPVEKRYNNVFSTRYYTIDFMNKKSGIFKRKYPATYGQRAITWWLVEAKSDIRIKRIKHSFHQCPNEWNTHWMHEHARDLQFMGGRMWWSPSYPCNYDSEDKTKLYPLVISVNGSHTLGDDKDFLSQVDPGCIITKFQDFFVDYPAFHISVQIPYPQTFTEEVPDFNQYPYHNGWLRYYHERSHGMVGCRLLIEKLLSDPNYNIDPNRIYLTGFSGGGLFSFEGLKGLRDILAAAVPIAAWPIYQAYGDPLSHPNWNTPFDDGGESLKDRLKKEMLRSEHIPTLVGVGDQDGMRHGSRAWQIVADEIGKDSQLKEYPSKHGGSPKRVWSDPENVEWLFSQTKKSIIPPDPYPNADYSESSSSMSSQSSISSESSTSSESSVSSHSSESSISSSSSLSSDSSFSSESSLSSDSSLSSNSSMSSDSSESSESTLSSESSFSSVSSESSQRRLDMLFKFTAKNSGYYRVFVDGVQVSQHITEREALEEATEQKTMAPEKEVYFDHDYKVMIEKK